jgi:hypothetical protein
MSYVNQFNTEFKLYTQCVCLQEKLDGNIDLADFNFPDGEYNVSIKNRYGDIVSKHNIIVKKNRTVQLFRRFDGSKKLSVAQTYVIPLNSIGNKVLQFILEKCNDIHKIFIDVIPSINQRVIGEQDMKNESDIPVVFTDIIKFEEYYMIVKGYMQVGKTKFIIASAVWHILNGMSSIIVLRNYNGDKDQMIRRISEFNKELQKFLGDDLKDKFKVEALSNEKININHLNGTTPSILISIANKNPLNKINKIIEDNPECSKKFILFIDEVDFIDSEGTCVQNELNKLREHCYCSYGVSATILDSTFKRDVDKSNVIVLSTPDNYKSIVNFKFIHLEFENHLVATTDGCIIQEDNNIISYLDAFDMKNPYYVELYDDNCDKNINPICYHPVDTLLRVSICNNPNLRLLAYIASNRKFPVMYFQGGEGSQAGKITASIPSHNTPITLINGCESRIQSSIILDDKNNTKLEGIFHIFDNASPSLVKEWMKNTGGGVERFPRIMTLAGGMAARCQSFGAADFNECLSNKTLAWHLTEMYIAVSTNMDQPELIQTAGRLCVVARDNIQPLFYATKSVCKDLIHAFQTQEELIERSRKSTTTESIGDIMKNLPIYSKKIVVGRDLTKKTEVKLNLVSKEDDKAAGGWSEFMTYCSREKDGKRIKTGKLIVNQEREEILIDMIDKKIQHVNVQVNNNESIERITDRFKYWSSENGSNTCISRFLYSLDPDKIYTKNEIKTLADDVSIVLKNLFVYKFNKSNGYGEILVNMLDKKVQLDPRLVDVHKKYFTQL